MEGYEKVREWLPGELRRGVEENNLGPLQFQVLLGKPKYY